MHVEFKRVQKPEEGPLDILAQPDAADHHEAAERRQVGDEVVLVGEIRAARVQRFKVFLHPLLVERRALEGAYAAEGVEIRFHAEIVVQILAAQAGDAGAQRPSDDLRFGFRMRFMKRRPLIADLMLDGQIHISPAAVHPKLKRLFLEFDRGVVPRSGFEDVRDPVDRAHGALKMDLDHVAVRLVMHLVIDLVGQPEQLADPGQIVFDRDVFDRIGDLSGVRVVLAGIDEIFLKG